MKRFKSFVMAMLGVLIASPAFAETGMGGDSPIALMRVGTRLRSKRLGHLDDC